MPTTPNHLGCGRPGPRTGRGLSQLRRGAPRGPVIGTASAVIGIFCILASLHGFCRSQMLRATTGDSWLYLLRLGWSPSFRSLHRSRAKYGSTHSMTCFSLCPWSPLACSSSWIPNTSPTGSTPSICWTLFRSASFGSPYSYISGRGLAQLLPR
jgi:hypothetical protein